MNRWERLEMLEGQRWEWRISMIFTSIVFLLFAILAGSATLGEWRERMFLVGMFWGGLIPLGYLVWTLMVYLDTGKHEEEGCLLAFVLFAISIILIAMGLISGVVIAFLSTKGPSICSMGYILSLSAGFGASIMAKNSYALYRDT